MKIRNQHLLLLIAIGMIGASLFYGSVRWNNSEVRGLESRTLLKFGTQEVGNNQAEQWAFSHTVGGFEYVTFEIVIKVLNGSVPVDIYLTTDIVGIDAHGNTGWFTGERSYLSKATVYSSQEYTVIEFPDDERECSGDNTYTLIFTSESPDLIS